MPEKLLPETKADEPIIKLRRFIDRDFFILPLLVDVNLL
jgi:hypothetical protein